MTILSPFSAWNAWNAAAVDQVIAPDGMSTVAHFTLSAASGEINSETFASINGSTDSVYIKQGTQGTKIQLLENASYVGLTFDFTSPAGNFQALPNGWFRVWFADPATAPHGFRIKGFEAGDNFYLATAQEVALPPLIDQAFLTPFANNSPWNIYPVNPVLGTDVIPTTGPGSNTNYAFLQNGAYASQMFYARASDPPATVTGNIADECSTRTFVIPHWPAAAVPATGTDHHMEIYDETTGLIHAFWALGNTGPGTWSCGEYAWHDAVNGTGFGSPSRPAGPRAAGVAAIAGMLRTWEQDLPIVNHALVLGVDLFTVKNGPQHPATMQDVNQQTHFTGAFPYGTRWFLPSTFDLSTVATPQGKAIARTAMKFGIILGDTTSGSFGGGSCNFYAEIGSWGGAALGDGTNQTDLVAIRNGLRPLVSQSGWLDRNGNPVTPTPWAAMQLMSMRGPWSNFGGGALPPRAGFFDSQSGFYEFPTTASSDGTLLLQSSRGFRDDASAQPWHEWADNSCFYVNPTPGAQYKLTVTGTPGVSTGAQLKIYPVGVGAPLYDSGGINPGAAPVIFTWPAGASWSQIFVAKTPGPPASVRLEMIAV